MRILNKISLICFIFCSFFLLGGCSEEEITTNQTGDYGYVQLSLTKNLTKSLVQGNTLEYLNDAKKIEIVLTSGTKTIRQALNLHAVNESAAENGLVSDKIQLLSGNYTITGYVIYGENVSDENTAEILQIADLNEPISISIQKSKLSKVDLKINAQVFGQLSFVLAKDLSQIQPNENQWAKTKATYTADYSEFDYSKMDSVNVYLRFGENGAPVSHSFKAKKERNGIIFHTDSITLPAGEYTLTQYEIKNAKKEIIYAANPAQKVNINHFDVTRDTIAIQLKMNEAIKDYIALRNIWEAMDGKNWSWNSDGVTKGVNWLFTYSDGSPRPIDVWGNQPGVELNSNGRVIYLNLGAFNPLGMVPDAIGQLTALEVLYLGTHSETETGESIESDNGTAGYSLDPYTLLSNGVNIWEQRWAIAREKSLLRYGSIASKGNLNFQSKKNNTIHFATKTDVSANDQGQKHNRITGISEEIGNLSESLTTLNIANGLISKLPKNFSKLVNLTDVEIYNCRLEEFPMEIAQLPELISINISKISGLSQEQMQEGLEAICNGPSQKKIQLLYLNYNLLKTLPSNMDNLTRLGLLDVAFNKLETVPAMPHVGLVQCFMGYNKLHELPDNFCKVEDIETFSATCNELETFPGFLSNIDTNYGMDEVDLSTNKISSFPASFKGIRVEQLNLNTNRIGGNGIKNLFPDVFSDTKSEIDYLLISNNELDSLPKSSFQNLKILQAFECSGNRLRYLPNDFNSEYLPWLSGVDMSFNRFDQFPNTILNCVYLNSLKLSTQGYYKDAAEKKFVKTMTVWPVNLQKHFALKIVDFSGNDFRKVTQFPTNVNYLDISDNPNIYMTVPDDIILRIINGSFGFVCDENQHIIGINE